MKFNSKAYDKVYPRVEKLKLDEGIPAEDSMVEEIKVPETKTIETEVVVDGDTRPDEPVVEQ